MKFAFVFPGQGSQAVGMMNAYGEHPVLRATFDEASQALGRDLWQLAQEGPAEAQSQTVNTQPLMLTAGVAVWRLWQELGGAAAPTPDWVAGHSLGEYAALVAAEVLSLSQAVPLVEFRAQAMQDAVPAGQGAMAAVLGLSADAVRACCDEMALGEVVEAVNFNAPEQTVIAGNKAAVERTAQLCKERGAKRALMLPVSAPFHCSLMQPAAQRLQEFLGQVQLQPPRIPLLNNVDVASQNDTEKIRDALVRQAAAPVRWVETMQALAAAGVSQVYECGPGKVLAGLVKRCVPELTGVALTDQTSLETALATIKA